MSVEHDSVGNLTDFATSAPTLASQGLNVRDKQGLGPQLLQLDVVAGTDATVSVWMYFTSVSAWVAIATGLTVTTGTATYVRVAPYARVFVQPTAQSGGPTNLLVSVVPGDM